MQNAAAPAPGVSEVLVVAQAVCCLATAADLHSSQATSEGSSSSGGRWTCTPATYRPPPGLAAAADLQGTAPAQLGREPQQLGNLQSCSGAAMWCCQSCWQAGSVSSSLPRLSRACWPGPAARSLAREAAGQLTLSMARKQGPWGAYRLKTGCTRRPSLAAAATAPPISILMPCSRGDM